LDDLPEMASDTRSGRTSLRWKRRACTVSRMAIRSYQRTDDGEDSKAWVVHPVTPRRSFEEILVQFQEAILAGALTVGQKLPPERELAEQFCVSRSSVREALRVLEALGVLTARRGSGRASGSRIAAAENGLSSLLPLYAKLRQVPLADLVDVRVSIEGMTAAGAARRGIKAAQALEPIANAMRDNSSQEDFLAADTRFHLEMARQSGNALAPLLMQSIREAIAREMLRAFRRLAHWDVEREHLIAEHEAIVRLIRTGQAAAAATAIERHIRGFYTRSNNSQTEVC
jgi:GntR family transcriptional regulator, transcriptional repressor for pyruvate dehydrogenase complex